MHGDNSDYHVIPFVETAVWGVEEGWVKYWD